MLASLMVHEWATPLNLSAPIAGIITIGGFMGYYSLSRKFQKVNSNVVVNIYYINEEVKLDRI